MQRVLVTLASLFGLSAVVLWTVAIWADGNPALSENLVGTGLVAFIVSIVLFAVLWGEYDG